MHILFIQHAEFETPGYIADWAAKKDCKLDYCSPFKGEKLPRGFSFDLIISMGGPQSASSDLSKYSYLKDEIDFLRAALNAKIPVLGFCLGAQLIGEALGASTKRSPHKEIGVFPILLTEEGMQDPLLNNLPKQFAVAHWHGDMPGLTKEAVILAKSEGCPHQIVRYFPYAYGFQCHPEMTLQGIEDLISNCPNDFTPDQYVQDCQDILAQNFYALNYNTIARILENFLELRKSWSNVLELIPK
jgi:GMP synthase (glutamine-hydrolysing)